ncbi:MAG: hypothetical protein A3K65_01395 [Euryarchaeota archaeon RBG_16_68_12]|nr:MAG: hypothetical protein A3K65_01395 [Euryarchaeota archaeon RBG_16_68_12]
MPLRERDLLPPVAAHFLGLGYEVFEEVEIAGRWADLVATGAEDVVAVELKMQAWRTAVRQAMAYQLGADHSYVALPLWRAQEAYRSRHAFEREGIGMLAVDPRGAVRTILRAAASPRQMPLLNEDIRATLGAGRRVALNAHVRGALPS